MRKAVFDSWALMAFFKGEEPAASEVEECLQDAVKRNRPIPISMVNWGEILYQFERAGGSAAAKAVESDIDDLPIEIVATDHATTRAAATLKAKGGLSYADCFAFALAKERRADLWTGDPELVELTNGLRIRRLSRK